MIQNSFNVQHHGNRVMHFKYLIRIDVWSSFVPVIITNECFQLWIMSLGFLGNEVGTGTNSHFIFDGVRN